MTAQLISFPLKPHVHGSCPSRGEPPAYQNIHLTPEEYLALTAQRNEQKAARTSCRAELTLRVREIHLGMEPLPPKKDSDAYRSARNNRQNLIYGMLEGEYRDRIFPVDWSIIFANALR